MSERIQKLIELRDFLNNESEKFAQAIELERYFFSTSQAAGCKCKFNTVKNKLFQYYQANKGEIPNDK